MRSFMHLLCSAVVLVAAFGCSKPPPPNDEPAKPGTPGANVAPLKGKKHPLEPPVVPAPPPK